MQLPLGARTTALAMLPMALPAQQFDRPARLVQFEPRHEDGAAGQQHQHQQLEQGGQPSSITVQRAQLADLDALVAIEDASRPGGHWGRSSVEAELVRERATVLVAEQQQRAVGLAVVWTMPANELHVLELAVLPEARRRGVARRLMQAAIDLHRPTTDVVQLEVRASNVAAQALYSQLGFQVVGVRKKYYGEDGEDAVLMSLDLSSSD